jgi:hypothetical protein
MQGEIHFSSELPRSGSTLLSAILRQNPRFHAGMTGPVGSLVDAMLRNMRMNNETSICMLPGDLVRKYENDAFWRDPARNLHQVKVI